jgi:hypothetical protein
MSSLSHEIKMVQNPALGGVLVWRFACGYSQNHQTGNYSPLQLAFLVLPIVFHRETFERLRSTRRPSGLHGFADKFTRSDVGESDVVLAIQPRAAALRSLTRSSIRIAVHTRLITVSSTEGTLIPITTTAPTGVPTSVKPLLNNVEKLGEWCADLTLFEVSNILKVAF